MMMPVYLEPAAKAISRAMTAMTGGRKSAKISEDEDGEAAAASANGSGGSNASATAYVTVKTGMVKEDKEKCVTFFVAYTIIVIFLVVLMWWWFFFHGVNMNDDKKMKGKE